MTIGKLLHKNLSEMYVPTVLLWAASLFLHMRLFALRISNREVDF